MKNDITQAEYESALEVAGFHHCPFFPGHVHTTMKDGTLAHFCEAAAQDQFETRREVLADLIQSRDWEEREAAK